jgi:hypothetical protein
MPLLERADCLLVIVDAQPGFVAHPSMSATEHEQSAAALGHAAWLAGLARLLDVPAVVVEEGVERNDATDETLRARLPPSTPVIGKTTFSLVAQPEAVSAIRATRRSTVVLVGFETDTSSLSPPSTAGPGVSRRCTGGCDLLDRHGRASSRARPDAPGGRGDLALQGHRVRVAAHDRRCDRHDPRSHEALRSRRRSDCDVTRRARVRGVAAAQL